MTDPQHDPNGASCLECGWPIGHRHDPTGPFGSHPVTRARSWRLLLAMLDPQNRDIVGDSMTTVLGETGGCRDCLIAMCTHLAGFAVATLAMERKGDQIEYLEALLATDLDKIAHDGQV